METKNTEMEAQDIFITDILVDKCRHIRDFKILLSETERKHLIITGKNGSGKTSLLELIIKEIIEKPYDGNLKAFSIEIEAVNFTANKFHPLSYQVLKEREDKEFIYAYLPVIKKVNFIPVNGVKNTHIEDEIIHRGIGMAPYFLQYLTNLKASKAFAIADGELDAAKKVDEWFERFEKLLKDIFDNPKLELKFDRKNYSFFFIEEGKEPYSFETLSDGYASVIAIVAELIMRMEAYEAEVYDIQGIVLIDEIESHLHVDLQKKILPFLTTFFPKIQFIVTTHSPFVISSMKDAVVCDLEHQIVANDLSTYSYDALLESYFGVDKYSNVLKEKVIEYEALSSKKDLAVEEKFELKELRAYLDQAPLFLSKELKVKLQQIDLNNLNKA
jgi:predicted ATP-binding protein involved in virulence